MRAAMPYTATAYSIHNYLAANDGLAKVVACCHALNVVLLALFVDCMSASYRLW